MICGIIFNVMFGLVVSSVSVPFGDIVGHTVSLEAKPNSGPFGRTSGQTVSLEAKPTSKCRISLSVGRQLPKLDRRVRLPYPAYI